jgi:hypothetical protein
LSAKENGPQGICTDVNNTAEARNKRRLDECDALAMVPSLKKSHTGLKKGSHALCDQNQVTFL